MGLLMYFVRYELFSKKNHNNFAVTQEFIGWQENNYAAPGAGLKGRRSIINHTQPNCRSYLVPVHPTICFFAELIQNLKRKLNIY